LTEYFLSVPALSFTAILIVVSTSMFSSSSALGMVCRALGYGLQVVIVKFLKGTQATGEDAFLLRQLYP
jgi:cob(I)alamin adenosyltransferase